MTEGLQFEWDDGNRNHVARHGVTPEEAEQAMANSLLPAETNWRRGELRTVCVGSTDTGRRLGVVYTVRSGLIRIVTAYP
ncbi:MAG: BrnT family toxin, partial [Terriglobia bacterium]